MESMANRIEIALRNKGGNQSELARFVGVTPQAVQKWIAGESEPKGKNLARAAEFLGVSASYLQFGAAAGIPNAAGREDAPRLAYPGGQLDPDVMVGIIKVLRELSPDLQRLALAQVQNVGLVAASHGARAMDKAK